MRLSAATRLAAVFALPAWLAACGASGPGMLVKDYPAKAPRRVAVLLFTNETTSLDAPEALRELVVKYLPRWGYQVLDVKGVDEKLREKGITDGGQLPTITPQELGQALGADGLLYGHVTAFQNTITGVYNRREVAAGFRLVHSRSGEKLWEAQEKEVSQETGIARDRQQALQKIALGLAKGLLAASLKQESEWVVLEALYQLPGPDGQKVKRFTPPREEREAKEVISIIQGIMGVP